MFTSFVFGLLKAVTIATAAYTGKKLLDAVKEYDQEEKSKKD